MATVNRRQFAPAGLPMGSKDAAVVAQTTSSVVTKAAVEARGHYEAKAAAKDRAQREAAEAQVMETVTKAAVELDKERKLQSAARFEYEGGSMRSAVSSTRAPRRGGRSWL